MDAVFTKFVLLRFEREIAVFSVTGYAFLWRWLSLRFLPSCRHWRGKGKVCLCKQKVEEGRVFCLVIKWYADRAHKRVEKASKNCQGQQFGNGPGPSCPTMLACMLSESVLGMCYIFLLSEVSGNLLPEFARLAVPSTCFQVCCQWREQFVFVCRHSSFLSFCKVGDNKS